MLSLKLELEQRVKEAVEKIKRPSMYFGHPINLYVGNPLNVHGNKELEFVRAIEQSFPEYHIENPNQPNHDTNYMLWNKTFPNEKGAGMKYYSEIIMPNMDSGIFLPFEDGLFGAGVFKEAKTIYEAGKPIWQINWDYEIVRILNLSDLPVLSIDETRARVRPNKH